MPNNKLKARVLAHRKAEARETRAQEAAESPEWQRMERKLGVEQHKTLKRGQPLRRK